MYSVLCSCEGPLTLSFQQAIRVLGLLGALDPYKHKVNIGMIDQSRDASAVSLSESKSSQDSGRSQITVNTDSFFFHQESQCGLD